MMKCDCSDPDQCWEPCGELGKSEEHSVKSSLTVHDVHVTIQLPGAIEHSEIKGEMTMKTPCEEKGYKVGDRFEVVDYDGDGTFSSGSIIELYRDDESLAPLFKLIKGSCDFYCCGSNAGAYLSLDKVKKIGEVCSDTTEVTTKMERGMFFDTKDMSGDQIRELCEDAESQGFSYFYSGGVDEVLNSEHRYIFLDEDGDILRDYDEPEEMFESRLVSDDMTVREADWKLFVKTHDGTKEPINLQVGDYLDLRGHTVTLDLIQKIADVAQKQGYGLNESVNTLYCYTNDHFMSGILIQKDGLCSRDDHFGVHVSEFKRKVTLDQWLESVDNDVSKDDKEEEQGMFKLELNDFIDFRDEDVTRELVEKVCEVIVANGYALDETAEEMYKYLVGNYEGIRIHPGDEDAYTVFHSDNYDFNRVLSVSEVLGDNADDDSEVDQISLLQTIDTLSHVIARTGSEKITKIVEELSEKAAKKFLG